MLATDQSEALRDRLVAELSDLKSADEAADWVHKNLAAKNTLTPADADTVEARFRERLATIEGGSRRSSGYGACRHRKRRTFQEKPKHSLSSRSRAASYLGQRLVVRRRRVAAKTIRLRDKEHCKFVATQPCVVCGRTPTEAHHIRFAQPRRWAAKSATNTRSQSAGSIIAICIAMAMRPHGGPGSASIPCRSRSNFGGDRD